MSKLNAHKAPQTAQFRTKRSADDELATFRSVVTSLKSQPEKLRGIVTKAGITTASGQLKKAYKG